MSDSGSDLDLCDLLGLSQEPGDEAMEMPALRLGLSQGGALTAVGTSLVPFVSSEVPLRSAETSLVPPRPAETSLVLLPSQKKTRWYTVPRARASCPFQQEHIGAPVRCSSSTGKKSSDTGIQEK